MNNKNNETTNKKVVVIGGGPAGLTASYQLSKANVNSIVLEKDQILGGISRTVNYNNYFFDIGGHRFFTKIKEVEDIWNEVLGDIFSGANGFQEFTIIKSFFITRFARLMPCSGWEYGTVL